MQSTELNVLLIVLPEGGCAKPLRFRLLFQEGMAERAAFRAWALVSGLSC